MFGGLYILFSFDIEVQKSNDKIKKQETLEV
jgi:hypothetical protein